MIDSDNDSGGSDDQHDNDDGAAMNNPINTERTLTFQFHIKKTITRSNRVAIVELWDQRIKIGRKSFSCQSFANIGRKENAPATLVLTMRIGSKLKEKKWTFASADDATRFHQVLQAMSDHGATLRSGFETLDKRRSGLIYAKDLQGTIKRIENTRISIADADAMLLSVNTDSFVIQTLSHTMGAAGSSSNTGGVNVRALFLYFVQSRFRDTREMLFEWRQRALGSGKRPTGSGHRKIAESLTEDDDGSDDSRRNSSVCWMGDEKPPLLCKGEKVLNIVQNVSFGAITQAAITPSIGNVYLTSYRLIFNAYFKQPASAIFNQMSSSAVSNALRNSFATGSSPLLYQPSLRREVPDCLTEMSLPFNSVMQLEKSKNDALGVILYCKDFRTIKLVFESVNVAFLESFLAILRELCFPSSIDQLFAFKHFKDYTSSSSSSPMTSPIASHIVMPIAVSAIRPPTTTPPPVGGRNQLSEPTRSVSISAVPSYVLAGWEIYTVQKEFTRQGVLPSELWRIWSDNYRLVDTYPREFVIPAFMSETEIVSASDYRSKKRLPALTWRNPYNGTLLVRSSQPMVGVSGARCFADEKLLSLFRVRGNPLDPDEIENPSEFFIFDARKPIAATGNQIQGKGTEKIEYYEMSRLVFCNIENIHAMRNSIHMLVSLIADTNFDDDNPMKFFAKLDESLWLKHVRGIIASSIQIAEKMILESASVLVHCSDGWDRTSQLVATVQLLLDPYYRTIEGFGVLVEKDWCQFGHKFQQRIGHAETHESHEISPIFVQWLDVIHQIAVQFPTSFEFNEDLLIFLADHLYSGLYGNFLGNNDRQRVVDLSVREKTVSIWLYVNHFKSSFLNPNYALSMIGAIWPSVGIGKVQLWERFFCAYNSDAHPKTASGYKWKHDWGAATFDGTESRADSNTQTRTYLPIQSKSSGTHSMDGLSSHTPPPRPGFLKANFFSTERASTLQRTMSFLPTAASYDDNDD